MNMYWIYDIPSGLLGLLFALAFIVFAMIGVFITRRIQKSCAQEEGWREHVVVLEGAFVFFGLLTTTQTLGGRQRQKPRRSGLSTT